VSRVTSGAHRSQNRNRAIWRAFWRGLPLALLQMLAGCLIPQTIDPVDTRAHIAPRIQVSSIPRYLLGPKLTMYLPGSNDTPPCHCVLELRIPQIVEDDPTVDLTARWFVNYDLSVPRSLSVAPGGQLTLPGTFDANVVVRGPVIYNFEPTALGLDPTQNRTHVVEMVVGETAGFDDSSTALPFRTMKPGYEAAVYRFVVDVKDAIPGQTCPSELPLQRPCQ
jgi:hypothetical protein